MAKLNIWRRVEGVYLPLLPQAGFNTNRWILNKQYESGEIHIIKSKLEKDDRIFEIGTGLGFLASYCAKVTGSNNVYTYEANLNNKKIIELVFQKNNVNPTFTTAYLTSGSGVFDFPVNNDSLLSSSAFIKTNSTVSVKKLDLNGEIREKKPTFLIMDIEGGEFDIFATIEFYTIKKVQFELHSFIIGKNKCEHIFDILSRNGFMYDPSVSSGSNFYFYR